MKLERRRHKTNKALLLLLSLSSLLLLGVALSKNSLGLPPAHDELTCENTRK